MKEIDEFPSCKTENTFCEQIPTEHRMKIRVVYIRIATFGELVTKQAMKENVLLYATNTYMLKLFVDVVTPGIEALGNGE
jgi:hypothetical protein